MREHPGMETTEEIELLEARTFMALDKYADSLGIKLSCLFHEFSEGQQQFVDPDAERVRACAYVAWSYYRDSQNGIGLKLSEVIDWARFYGYLSGALQIIDFDARFDPVENGKKGLANRHAPMRQLKLWAIAKFRSGSWSSANAAALALEKDVVEHGRTINATLSPTNARRTIAEWIRKSV